MSSTIGKIVDWDRLPDELLYLILEKISSAADITKFASVCMRWKSVFLQTYGRFMCKNQVPMLMIPTKDKSSDRRSLFCITENKTLGIQLNIPYNKRCSGSSHGWLAFAEDNLAITLYNPVSGAVICLPPVMDLPDDDDDPDLPVYDINKVILSADPSLHPESYEVIVKYSYQRRLCFIKAGEKEWTRFPCGYFATSDMIYHKDKIYAATRHGKIGTLDTSNLNTQKIANDFSEKASHVYLAESSGGDLMIILRYFCNNWTSKFEVYKLAISAENMERIERVYDLNGDVLFLGDNHSLSNVASKIPGCKPNCIYFSDDYRDLRSPYEYEGPYDMGIFNMADESIQKHYDPNPSHKDMPPPFWFLPDFTHMFCRLI